MLRKPNYSLTFSVRKFLYIFLIFFCFSAQTFPVDFEVNLQGSWGKRFQDSFDKNWAKIRYSTSDVSQTSKESELSQVRNILNGYVSFLISPLFRHYFGVSFTYMAPISEAQVKSEIGSSVHTSSLGYNVMSPAIAYKFYPFAGDKTLIQYLYFAADIGIGLANFNLFHKKVNSLTGTSSENIEFKNINGVRGSLRMGIKLPAFSKNTRWILEGGFDIARYDDLEGAFSSNGAITSLTLKSSSDGQLVAVSNNDVSKLPKTATYNNAAYWMSQFLFSVGMSFAF